jgi:hypothetical protein
VLLPYEDLTHGILPSVDGRRRDKQEKMVAAKVEKEQRSKNLNIKRESDIKK